ncbi:MAG: HAMP domain-containing sensor histidine kinase [Acidobacteriota bacterium]
MNKLIFNIIDRIKSKLFLKISLVFIISMVVVLISSITIQRIFFLPKVFPKIIRNTVDHGNYMIKEIGIPPDLKIAEKISKKMNIRIRIKYNGIEWKSHKGIARFKEINLPEYSETEGIKAGFNSEGLCVFYEKGPYKILMVMHSKKEGFNRAVNSLIILILGFVSLVIIILYFIIRWLLRPVRVLKEGVDRISNGNFEVEIPSGNSDELGKLIDSFNSMGVRIESMIKSRDQLLRDVSHELRSPITRVKIGMELIEDSKNKKGILEDILEVEMMISELLETDRLNSRFGKLNLERINVIELIRVITKEFSHTMPGTKFDQFPNNLYLNLDRDRATILFRNIISNALRYSDKNGDPVRISCEKGKIEVTIKISDSGIGIPEEEIPYIFEPFYRVDKSRSRKTGGYGLGMSLSKKVMDAHGGGIKIISSPGKGTCVELKFFR